MEALAKFIIEGWGEMFSPLLIPILTWWRQVLTPMLEIVIWGFLTLSVYLYTLYQWLEDEDPKLSYNVIAAILMSLLWTINITTYLSADIHWTIFTDGAFVGVSLLIYLLSKRKWALVLAFLYCISVRLDYAFWKGFDFTTYARLANTVYVFQLLTVSGWLTRKHKKTPAPFKHTVRC